MNSLSIRTKLLLCFLFLGVTLVALVGWIGYTTGKNALTHASLESLKSIREMKKRQIERYFEYLRQQCFMLASQDATIEAMKLFKETFYTVKDELNINTQQLEQYKQALAAYYQQNILQKINIFYPNNPLTFQDLAPQNNNALILQYLYLVKNKASTMPVDQLHCIAAGSRYSKVYAHYIPLMREYSKRMRVHDVYLFDLETGYSLLETAGEIDFANSVINGGLKNTNLAQAIEYIRTVKEKNSSKLVDFQFYVPSLGAPAAFIAVPIFDGDKKIGGLAFELLIDEINYIMTDNKRWKDVGLGNTGESFLLGSDYKMRSISRVLVENPTEYFKMLELLGTDRITLDRIKLYNTSILLQDTTTMQAEAAIQGKSGVTIAPDYRGVQVFAAYAPVSISDVQWGIVSKIDAREALAPVTELATRVLIVSLIALALLGILTVPFTRWILAPIRQLNSKVQQALIHKLEPAELEESSIGDVGILSHSIAQLYARKIEFEDKIYTIIQELDQTIQRMHNETAALTNLQESMPESAGIKDVVLVFDQAVEQSRQYRQHYADTIVYTKKLSAELIDTIHAGIAALMSAQHSAQHSERDFSSIEKYLRQALYTSEQLTEYIQLLESVNAALNTTQENVLTVKQQLVTQVQNTLETRQESADYTNRLAHLTREVMRIIERLKEHTKE